MRVGKVIVWKLKWAGMAWILACSCLCCQVSQSPTITEIVSADTVILNDGEKIHYAGLVGPASDSPWFGFCREANGYLVHHKTVRLVWETPDRQDGTKAAYVYTPILVGQETKYLFVNAELVKFGFAKAMPIPKDCQHRELWQSLWDVQENDAKPEQRGMWGKERP